MVNHPYLHYICLYDIFWISGREIVNEGLAYFLFTRFSSGDSNLCIPLMKVKRELLNAIRARKWSFVGHLLRENDGMGRHIETEMVGKRARG